MCVCVCVCVYVCVRLFVCVCAYSVYILVAPRFKNLLRLEAGYPALRCHNFKTINRSHAHNTHDKNKDDTGNSKTPKHSHTHKTHSLTQRRATTT